MWCIYDNLYTGRREEWHDGSCVFWVDFMALDRADRWFYLNSVGSDWFGPFRPGRVKGSPWALVDKVDQIWM